MFVHPDITKHTICTFDEAWAKYKSAHKTEYQTWSALSLDLMSDRFTGQTIWLFVNHAGYIELATHLESRDFFDRSETTTGPHLGTHGTFFGIVPVFSDITIEAHSNPEDDWDEQNQDWFNTPQNSVITSPFVVARVDMN